MTACRATVPPITDQQAQKTKGNRLNDLTTGCRIFVEGMNTTVLTLSPMCSNNISEGLYMMEIEFPLSLSMDPFITITHSLLD